MPYEPGLQFQEASEKMEICVAGKEGTLGQRESPASAMGETTIISYQVTKGSTLNFSGLWWACGKMFLARWVPESQKERERERECSQFF